MCAGVVAPLWSLGMLRTTSEIIQRMKRGNEHDALGSS